MPHDKFGKLLQVNDEVIVRFRVKEVQTHEEYCNVTLQTIECMEGDPTNLLTISAINTKQTEKV